MRYDKEIWLFILKSDIHRGRNQRYSFQIDLDHGSSTLQFLQFWNQNVVNILFLVLESLEVISGFISKLMKFFSRWRHHWNIWRYLPNQLTSSCQRSLWMPPNLANHVFHKFPWQIFARHSTQFSLWWLMICKKNTFSHLLNKSKMQSKLISRTRSQVSTLREYQNV